MKYTYLDYAAATPVDAAVLEIMEPYFTTDFYNPSASYGPAKAVRIQLSDARAKIAGWLGARLNELVFTAGGTEANNVAISGVMQRFPDARCLVSAIEHDSVRLVAQQYDHGVVGVETSGRIAMDKLQTAIDDRTVLLSVIYVSNEIGTVQSLKSIAALLRNIRKDRRERGITLPLYLHTDACQAPNYLDLHVSRLGVDMMTLNGGKIYGPKQAGCLYVRRDTLLQPIILGGGQEGGKRSGTENVAFAAGLAAALDIVQQDKANELMRMKALQRGFLHGLTTQVPNSIINGSIKHRVANNVHVTFPGFSNERLLLGLEETGILAAAGSACGANKRIVSSPVLLALGKTPSEAQSSVRFSFGRNTTKKELEHTVTVLGDLLSQKQ